MHVHALLFVDPATDPDPIGEAMFAAWAKRLTSLGLDAPAAGPGMQIKRLDLANAAAEVAEYLAKGQFETADEARRRAALELASTSKLARGRNRSPMQVLADFVARGEADDAELWREWETASKGRRALTWSRGARDHLLQDDDEATDEELAQETDNGGQVVALIDPQVWGSIVRRPRLMSDLLTFTELAAETGCDLMAVLGRLLERNDVAGAAVRPAPGAR